MFVAKSIFYGISRRFLFTIVSLCGFWWEVLIWLCEIPTIKIICTTQLYRTICWRRSDNIEIFIVLLSNMTRHKIDMLCFCVLLNHIQYTFNKSPICVCYMMHSRKIQRHIHTCNIHFLLQIHVFIVRHLLGVRILNHVIKQRHC